jgi:hypothetical protein
MIDGWMDGEGGTEEGQRDRGTEVGPGRWDGGMEGWSE